MPIFPSKNRSTISQNSNPDQVTLNVTWAKKTPLINRAIVINLLEGITPFKRVQSFVELVKLRSELSSTSVQNRIRVGNFIASSKKETINILLFRSNKMSHMKFLEKMKKEG